MNIAQALNMRGQVDSYERQEALWLLEHLLQRSALELKLSPTQHLSAQQEQQYLHGLMRLAKNEPLAYIIGHQPFWTLNLKVTPDTLVPRPDTEILVETVLNLQLIAHANILDLGTGSGAIALALASERPRWRVTATDIYAATLAVAQENAHVHQLSQVNFILSAWYQDLPAQKFDLIVSNPPYIDPADPHVANLTHEPQRALVAQHHGLADLEHIIKGAGSWLNPEGWLVLEHGYDQAYVVRELFKRYAFVDVSTVADYGGNERVSLGKILG